MSREPADGSRGVFRRIRAAPLHRWAQLGVIVVFLALVRILAEYFRLRASEPAAFTLADADRWVGGALLAAVLGAITVGAYLLGRDRAVVALAILTVLLLLAYKLAVFGPLP